MSSAMYHRPNRPNQPPYQFFLAAMPKNVMHESAYRAFDAQARQVFAGQAAAANTWFQTNEEFLFGLSPLEWVEKRHPLNRLQAALTQTQSAQ